MAQDNFGKHWELAELLTTPGGQNNLNLLKPMGFAFQDLAIANTLQVKFNGINWVKGDGATIEANSYGPLTVPANQTTYYWIDINGNVMNGLTFPLPSSQEFFALAKVVANATQITQLHQYGNPIAKPGAIGSISGQLVGVSQAVLPQVGGSPIPLPFAPVSTLAVDFIVQLNRARLFPGDYIYSVGPNEILINGFPIIIGDMAQVNYQRA